MILVTGQARSGTTLVWRLLVAAGFRLAYEPLYPHNPAPPGPDGSKQPWSKYLGDSRKYYGEIVRVRRDCFDTCYSQWMRVPLGAVERPEPAHLIAHWQRNEAEMDVQIPHALSVEYLDLCASPLAVMGPVIEHLGGGGAVDGWGDVELPEWASATHYRIDRIEATPPGRWRTEPAWGAFT